VEKKRPHYADRSSGSYRNTNEQPVPPASLHDKVRNYKPLEEELISHTSRLIVDIEELRSHRIIDLDSSSRNIDKRVAWDGTCHLVLGSPTVLEHLGRLFPANL
jgi:hypothetical protein